MLPYEQKQKKLLFVLHSLLQSHFGHSPYEMISCLEIGEL